MLIHNLHLIGTTALSLGNGTTSSFGGSFYAGLGATFFGIASAEAGYEHGFNSTECQRQLMFIDVNGDGLPQGVNDKSETTWFGYTVSYGWGYGGSVGFDYSIKPLRLW
jgi:hypothetical protein